MNASFDYDLAAQLNDGSEVKLNPEEHGWAEPERLAKVTRWTLLPRAEGWPVVMLHIPEGAKPVFMSRVFGKGLPGAGGPSFRTYCTGWHKDGETHRVWVLPGGIIEVGEEPTSANLLLDHLGKVWAAQAAKERQEQNA